MNKNLNKLSTFILDSFKQITNHQIINNELIVSTSLSKLHSFLIEIKEKNELKFEMLLDITAVDYPQRSKRFELVYNLLSLKNHLRLRVKVFLNYAFSSPGSFTPSQGLKKSKFL